MSRTIILLGLTQALAVILSFFALGIVLRRYGYPNEPFQPGGLGVYHWSRLAWFLRCFGLLLLLVPLAWTISAAIAEKRAGFIIPFDLWLILGTGIPCATIVTFFYAIFHPYVYAAVH